jgi:hypothetical protein
MSSEKTTPTRPIPESYWVLPGQFLAGEYPGTPYLPEFTRKRIGAFLRTGFDTFIDLTGRGETEAYEPILCEEAANHGVQVQYSRFPIADFGLPSVEVMQATLDAIDAAVAAGHKVYLHCHGGVGRTGTAVGCYLVQHGCTGAEALDKLAEMWSKVPKSARYPHSPETVQQEQFILDWGKKA